MPVHGKINYVEFPAKDIPATKAFFNAVFAWEFEDYGPAYSAFSEQGLDGGFFQSKQCSLTEQGAALIVLYSDNLQQTALEVEKAGGIISKAIFSFPGGSRFHFIEPSGNEMAVWSDTV